MLVRQVGWRPRDWKNPHVDLLAKECGFPDSPYEAVFEAGADAMLQALNESMRCNCPRCTGIPDPYTEKED